MTQQPAPPAVPNQAQPVQTRNELQQQLESLMKERVLYREALAQQRPGSPDAVQMERMLPVVDERIRLLEFQLQAVPLPAPGTTQPAFPPPPALPALPNEYVVLATLLILVTLLPLSVALARRLWRGTSNPATANSSHIEDRLAHMQGAIDSIALEVERIGEGQRYVTGLLNPSAKALPLDLRNLPEAVQKPDSRSITPH